MKVGDFEFEEGVLRSKRDGGVKEKAGRVGKQVAGSRGVRKWRGEGGEVGLKVEPELFKKLETGREGVRRERAKGGRGSGGGGGKGRRGGGRGGEGNKVKNEFDERGTGKKRDVERDDQEPGIGRGSRSGREG